MKFTGSRKAVAAALAVGVIVGGGLTVVAPAVASQDASYAATNWKKIWKTKLQKYADKRYYTKKKANAKFATKVDLGNYYTKAQSDAGYAAKGSSYTKAESDGRYARSTALIRGNILLAYTATAAGEQDSGAISFGATFSAAPTVHVIPSGGPVPADCAGSAAAPDASPGHLCIFTSLSFNNDGLGVCKPSTAVCAGGADPWGTVVYTNSSAVGLVNYFATWAARPIGVVSTASALPMGGGVNPGATGSGTLE